MIIIIIIIITTTPIENTTEALMTRYWIIWFSGRVQTLAIVFLDAVPHKKMRRPVLNGQLIPAKLQAISHLLSTPGAPTGHLLHVDQPFLRENLQCVANISNL